MADELIVSDLKIMMGKPVVEGARIAVELILEKLAAGESLEQLIEEHPRLTEQTIREALDFAGRALKADVIYPLNKEAG